LKAKAPTIDASTSIELGGDDIEEDIFEESPSTGSVASSGSTFDAGSHLGGGLKVVAL